MHYTADITALGLDPEPSGYRATVELSDHVQIVATDENPFWVMCEVLKALRELGATGTVEGFYEDNPVFDPFGAHGLPIEKG